MLYLFLNTLLLTVLLNRVGLALPGNRVRVILLNPNIYLMLLVRSGSSGLMIMVSLKTGASSLLTLCSYLFLSMRMVTWLKLLLISLKKLFLNSLSSLPPRYYPLITSTMCLTGSGWCSHLRLCAVLMIYILLIENYFCLTGLFYTLTMAGDV